MSLGLYMDVHVPLPITRGLRRRGVDVLTAQQDGTTRLLDSELLNRAAALRRMLFSQVDDLIAEAVRRQRCVEAFATVVFARQLDLSIGRCNVLHHVSQECSLMLFEELPLLFV